MSNLFTILALFSSSTIFKYLLLRNLWASRSQISIAASVGWGNESSGEQGVWVTWPKMAATPTYGIKNHFKIFSGTKGPMTLGLGMQHLGLGPNKVCSINDLMEETYNNWPEWQKIYVDIKILTPRLSAPTPGLYTCKHEKIYIKSDFFKEIVLNCNKWAKW